ncbi:hypothetical protein vseg_019296 [Gypsophila vaccaria]
MSVCQICGDKGYQELLVHCAQCQDVAIHRYCVLCPFISKNEEFNWSCEFCDPGKTKPTTPIRESKGLSASIEPAAPQKIAQETLANNSFPSQSEKSNAVLEGTAKGATDLSILDQKKQYGRVRGKRSKRKKRESPVLLHVSDATKDLLLTDIGKADSSCNDANECKKELSQGRERPRQQNSTNAMKGKEIKDSISENSVEKGCSESSQETEQKMKSVNSSDTPGCQLVKIETDAGPLLSEGDDTVNESTCMAGDIDQGDFELVKQEKVTGSSLPKSKIQESSSKVFSKHSEESHISANQLQDTELDDHADQRKIEISETAIVLCEQVDVQSICDIGKADNSCSDVNECKQELSRGRKRSRRLRRRANAKNGKKIEDSISDNIVKQGCFESSQETEQKIKSVNSSDTPGCQLVKIGKDAGPLLSEVDDTVNESMCMAGDVNQGDFKLVKHEQVTGSSLPKSKIHIEESSSKVLSEHSEESHSSANQPQDTDLDDHADQRRIEILETAIVLCEQADVQSIRDIGKADNSSSDVNECKQELSQGRKRSRRLRQRANANNGKKIEDSISDNIVKQGCFESAEVTEQKIKNVNSSDTTGCQLVKMGNNADPLLSEVDNIVNNSTCMAGDDNQGDSELVKQEKVTGCSLPKSKIQIEESTSKVFSKHSEESHISTSQPQDAELADLADKRKIEIPTTAIVLCEQADERKIKIPETAILLCEQSDVQSIRDVSECPAPRKKRKLVIEVEYSDEDPVIVVSKHPHLLADAAAKDRLSKSSSEALSKLSDDCPAQLSSVESVLTRPPPRKVVDHVLTRETSVVFDNCVSTQPSPTILVNYVPAKPLIDVAWRGHWSIGGNECSMSLELEAHLSNKAHEKVQGAVNLLPQLLNLHFAPKKYAQPRSFEESPPTSDVIGLYLLPVDEWTEKVYDCLVNEMIVHDLVLKSVINNLEFLVFCSRELPQEEWSFQRKYYLWAVFKPIKDPVMPNNRSNSCISYVQSPVETFYLQNRPSITYSNTHFHRGPVAQPARLTRPMCWNLRNQAYIEQGYDIHQTLVARQFQESQEYQHHHDARFSDYVEQGHCYPGSKDKLSKRLRKLNERDRTVRKII